MTGWSRFITELQTFIDGIGFAHPQWLWLGLLPIVVVGLRLLQRRRTQHRFEQLGDAATLYGLIVHVRALSVWTTLIKVLGWSLLILAAIGPRWGERPVNGVAVGRDVVIVLDFSQSMLAADMDEPLTRWQAAIAGIDDMLVSLERRPGDRVGLVLFAAKPKVLVPLTTDLTHIRGALRELDANYPPEAIRPDEFSPSGTRIGLAIARAVDLHDNRYSHYQDVIVLSDGDDPSNDREWIDGINVARSREIAVHTVGLGDPERASTMIRQGEPLRFEGEEIRSRLHEEVLEAIADEGRGFYLPSRQSMPKLSTFFQEKIEPLPTRMLDVDAFPQPRDRSGNFLACGLALVAIGWWRRPF